MLSIEDFDLSDLKPASEEVKQRAKELAKKRIFVPYCRVLPEYRDAFKNRDYNVTKMPPELYALFLKEA